MDLTAILETIGDSGTVVLGALLIGLMFGVFAQRSRFCLRAAVVEFSRGAIGPKMAVWLIAFSAAILGTQILINAGVLDVSASRQLGSAGSLSGAIIGGLMFGVGMVLTRGCPGRLLVLSAIGNLRALLSGLIFVVAAQASLRGVLAPLREDLAGLWVIEAPSNTNALTLAGFDSEVGLMIALGFMGLAIYFAARSRVSAWAWAGGLGVGATIALGWLFTYSLSYQAWEPVTVKSLSFTGPSADAFMLILTSDGSALDFDIGLVPGVFLGAFLAALVCRDLKLEGFSGGYAMRRYILGALLMGFGGMLAGGCAIGAGVTGGSVFAVTAWTALCCMWAGAALADVVVDRRGLILRDQAADTENAAVSAVAQRGWSFLPAWLRLQAVRRSSAEAGTALDRSGDVIAPAGVTGRRPARSDPP